MVAGAGALCRYSKPLPDSWHSLRFALGQLVLVEGLSLLLFEKPPLQILDSSNGRVQHIQLANQLLDCGHNLC